MSTPPRTPTSDAKSVTFSTPMSASSAQNSETILEVQDWLVKTMGVELYHAAYDSEDTIKKICPSSSKTVTAVIELLKSRKITPESLVYRDTGLETGASVNAGPNAKLRAWPIKGSGELKYYVPFSWLLNQVCDAFREKRKGFTGYYQHLRFFVHGRVMKEAIGNSSPLKPDIVGTQLSELPRNASLSWSKVPIPVEVKKRWSVLVKQAATYARAVFATFDNRRFVLVINYNQGENAVRFCFYHRAGLIASLPFVLDDPNGFKGFVGAMVGIMSWTTADAAGVDTTRTNTLIALPTIGLHRIINSLCVRNNVRGRATRVYVVEKENPKQDSPHPPEPPKHRFNLRLRSARQPSSAPKGPQLVEEDPRPRRGLKKTTRKSPASAEHASLPSRRSRLPKLSNEKSSLGRDPDSGASTAQIKPHIPQPAETPKPEEIDDIVESFTPSTHQEIEALNSNVPHTLIVKDSYPLLSQCHEGEMFESVKGQFGVPDILCEYVVQDSQRVEDRTSNFLPENTKYWKVFQEEGVSPAQELRVHVRLISTTRGVSLCDVQGPYQVLQSILHAMAGHWNLFKAGWLHRDISIGNVLGLAEGLKRPAVTDFDVTKDRTECTGVLIDGDQAVRWRDSKREVASRRSGTLPFIAYRLLQSWNDKEPDLHTALDDLESFIWVLVWVILLVTESKHGLNMSENKWLLSMDHKDLMVLAPFKVGFRIMFAAHFRRGTLSNGFKVLAPLLSQWLEIAAEAADQIGDALARSDGLELTYLENTTKKYLERYLIAGYETLSTLSQDSWEQILV